MRGGARRGAGAPKKLNNAHRFNCWLDERSFDMIKRHRERHGLESDAEALRHLLRMWERRNQDG